MIKIKNKKMYNNFQKNYSTNELKIDNKMLEKIYPIYQIKAIKDLEINLKKDNLDNKNNNIINSFNKFYDERDNIIKKLEENKNLTLYQTIISGASLDPDILFKIFTNNSEYFSLDYIKNDLNIHKLNGQLYKNIKMTAIRDKNKYLPYYFESQLYVDNCYKRIMDSLANLYLLLEQNGNVLIYYLYPSYNMIKLYYLCSILFEEVYLVFRNIIICKKFKNNIKYLKYITDIIQNDYEFNFSENINYEPIFDYLKYHIKYDLFFKYQLIVKKNKDIYNLYWYSLSNLIKELGYDVPKKDLIYFNKIKNIKSMKKKNIFVSEYDNYYLKKLFENINSANILSIGYFKELNNILKENYNILYLLNKSEKDNKLTKKKLIIKSNYSISNKLDKTDLLIELYNKKNIYDFVFLYNVYDYNYLIYYSLFMDKILNKNGYLIIINAHFDEINKSVLHIENTMKNYKKINSPANIAVFKKV